MKLWSCLAVVLVVFSTERFESAADSRLQIRVGTDLLESCSSSDVCVQVDVENKLIRGETRRLEISSAGEASEKDDVVTPFAIDGGKLTGFFVTGVGHLRLQPSPKVSAKLEVAPDAVMVSDLALPPNRYSITCRWHGRIIRHEEIDALEDESNVVSLSPTTWLTDLTQRSAIRSCSFMPSSRP